MKKIIKFAKEFIKDLNNYFFGPDEPFYPGDLCAMGHLSSAECEAEMKTQSICRRHYFESENSPNCGKCGVAIVFTPSM